MLHKLKNQLLRVCIINTTLIIIITTLIALVFSEKQLYNRNQLNLKNNVITIVEHLQNQVISYNWLTQMENSNSMIIDISTPTSVLSFPGSYITDSKRKELLSLVSKYAEENYNLKSLSWNNTFYNTPSITFELRPNHEHYLNLITSVTYNDIPYQIILIQDMSNIDLQILRMRIFFVILIIIASGALSLFSFWFVSKAMKPIEISQKEQTNFVAAASHELRSPLAVIRTSLDDLLEDTQIQDKHQLNIIDRECNQLTRLVNDLLFLAKTDAGHFNICKKPIELDTLLLDCYDSFFSLAQSHGYLLDLELPDTKQEPLSLDSERITQALSILINNAFAYTPPTTQITLSLVNTPNSVQLTVADNGPGIKDELKPLIFERFYRGDTSRHKIEHCGLGLSIAYEIMKLHHGTIKIKDTTGGGATFILELPII